MKCRDCEKWGWGDDEGAPVWGWCWKHTSCPDPDIDRSCSDFSPKKPDIFKTLSTLQAENEKLLNEVERQRRSADNMRHLYENAERAYINVQSELEQAKRERDAAVDCIYKIEDDLDRGNDNDWAREHISEWESQKED